MVAQQPSEVTIVKMDGSKTTWNQLIASDSIVVISFWATWCGPCRSELNRLSKVYEDWHRHKHVVMYAINVGEPRAKAVAMIEKKKWPYEFAFDYTQKLILSKKKYSGEGYVIPHVFVYKHRKLVWTNITNVPSKKAFKFDPEYYSYPVKKEVIEQLF